MTRILRLVCTLGAVITLASCATTANFEKNLNTWVGAHVDRLVSAWGPPQATYPLSNGGQVLQYSSQRDYVVPGYEYTTPQTSYQSGNVNLYGSRGGYANGDYSGTTTTYVQHRTADIHMDLSCAVRFTVDSAGYVRQWNWQGNNCRS